MIARCRCCGLILAPDSPRAAVRRCVVCDLCGLRHGDELEAVTAHLVATGQIPMWLGIASMAVDDANITGHLKLRGDPMAADMWIDAPVPRWAVVMGRAVAMGEQPAVSDVIAAVVNRYVPGPSWMLGQLKQELIDALTTLDPNVAGIEVDLRRDTMDLEGINISILMRTPAGPGAMTLVDDVEIPEGVSTMPRGQA